MSCLLEQKNLPEGLAFLPIRPTMKAAFRVPHLPRAHPASKYGTAIEFQPRVPMTIPSLTAPVNRMCIILNYPSATPSATRGFPPRAVVSVINFFFEHLIRKVSRELQPVRPQKGIRVEIPAISQSRALFFLSVPYAMPTVVPSDGN